MESASLLADCKESPTFQMLYSDPMDETYKKYLFNPPHYFVPNAMYMVTGAILHNQHFLNEDKKRQFLLETLFDRSKLLGWEIQAWAILNNHYHFIGKAPENASTLSKLTRQIHSITAVQFNQWDKTFGRQVWFNYWDTCLTYEKAYLARLHYVHMNQVKHGLVENAMDYPYCSYRWFIEQGHDSLRKQVLDQPINRINVTDDF